MEAKSATSYVIRFALTMVQVGIGIYGPWSLETKLVLMTLIAVAALATHFVLSYRENQWLREQLKNGSSNK